MDPFSQNSSSAVAKVKAAKLSSLFINGVKNILSFGRRVKKNQRIAQDPSAGSNENFINHWNTQFQNSAARINDGQYTGSDSAAKPGTVPLHRPKRSVSSIIQFTIAVLVAAVPVSYYFVQPDNLTEAIASIDERRGGQEGRQLAQPVSTTANATFIDKSQRLNNLQLAANTSESLQNTLDDSAIEHAEKHANPNYICPMHAEVVTNDPNAICPICGMDLVLLETGGDVGVVKLTPQVINSLGVRTAKAKRRTLYRRIDSVGYINVDENNMRSINLRTDGWLEYMSVKTAGERVIKGQLLFELYSPKLVNAQEEYVQAMEHDNDLLLKASRERLRALGVSDDQIQNLEMERKVEQLIKIYAPQSGIVSALRVREGMYVKPSQSIIELVDLSSVWLMVDVFERQANWVEIGQRAEATLPFMPEKAWEGQVEYVYPSLDATTRSLKVRLRFDNVEEDLKPNMYADVTIFAKPRKKVLAIPKEAVIVTGNQKRVIVALGEGRFIPMSITVGMEAGDKVEVTRGLSEGDEVVTSSQFLIDSESSLKASLARMAGGS